MKQGQKDAQTDRPEITNDRQRYRERSEFKLGGHCGQSNLKRSMWFYFLMQHQCTLMPSEVIFNVKEMYLANSKN